MFHSCGGTQCRTARRELGDALISALVLVLSSKDWYYLMDTCTYMHARDFGIGGPQGDTECDETAQIIVICWMCVQFCSYPRGVRFTIPTGHKSHLWHHQFKNTEGMMTHWIHTLQQFNLTVVHRPCADRGNTDKDCSSSCPECTCLECLSMEFSLVVE